MRHRYGDRRRPARHIVLLFSSLALFWLPRVESADARQLQPPTLTLDEAIGLALRYNPDYLSQRRREAEADWAVREARGALLPMASVSTGAQYQAPGSPRLGIFTGTDLGVETATSYYLSSYTLGMSYRFGGASLARISQEEAARDATMARIDAGESTLRADVTRQYLAVVRAGDGVVLARRELDRARDNLRLAEARVAVGAGIPLESRQAEVEVGRAEVSVLQAESQQRTEAIRLVQRLGIELDPNVQLTTEFQVFEPPWTLDELTQRAIAAHPQLRALAATRRAAEAGVRAARSAYLPTLEVSAGWSGFTRQAGNSDFLVSQAHRRMEGQRESCVLLNMISERLTSPLPGTPADCSAMHLTPEQERQIRADNRAFPFSFDREPWSASLRVSVPIFTGFTRPRQVESARVQVEEAEHRLRAEELRLRSEVAAAHEHLVTAERSVELEERNRALAQDQLRMAQERFAEGVAAFMELSDAETVMARADRAYLLAVYTFHEALAALEAAVGSRLAPDQDTDE